MRSKAVLAAVMFLGMAWSCWASVAIDNPRCEYQVDPLGIDVMKPRLSWTLKSDERGQQQSAYQVLVASSFDALARDQGDLWDSGRVASDQTIHVEYAGKPLGSQSQCFWKVRAWDQGGLASAWSKPGHWTMGLLAPADWKAKWIAYLNPADPPLAGPHNGYHCEMAAKPDLTKWVAIDLGREQTIDAVQLFPARPYDYPDTPGFLFPLRFKIEAARKADFSDAKVVVDQTSADVPNPHLNAPVYRFAPVAARHVRLTVTCLTHRDANNYGVALAEFEVLAGGKNVALHAAVTASDSIEAGGWSKSKLVDGRLLPEQGADVGQQPATMLRKEFELRGPVRRAVVSVTGLGLYELSINGQRVGDHVLAPDYTRYSKRIQYQTYDVTALVRAGRNAVGAQLGGGWWTGPLMCMPPPENTRFCLLMRLDVELADGTTQTLVTDPSWQATSDGPIRKSGIYFGETYDATKEQPGWNRPGFAATGWRAAQTLPHPALSEHAALAAQGNEPIRVTEERRPVRMTEPKPGVYIFDMGQNMVGWCRLTATAPAGTKINVRYAEVLNDDGTIYTANFAVRRRSTNTPGAAARPRWNRISPITAFATSR